MKSEKFDLSDHFGAMNITYDVQIFQFCLVQIWHP